MATDDGARPSAPSRPWAPSRRPAPAHRRAAAIAVVAVAIFAAGRPLSGATAAPGAAQSPAGAPASNAPATQAAPPPATTPATTTPATAPPATAPPTGRRRTPADLRGQFEKCLKSLRKAGDAVDGRDAGRVSLLLRRADELIVEFDAAAGIDEYAGALAASRAAAAAGDFDAAGAALRHGRGVLRSLEDYTVARPTEVAYRSALSALEDGNPHDFEAALGRLEATFPASYLSARLRDARGAIARGRAAMVRNDMTTGRKEVAAARTALGRMDYAASLGQARHGLLVAAELLRDGSFLTAREQARQGIRSIRDALGRAPDADVETLNRAEATANDVWRRLSRPNPDDPGLLEGAADQIETLRLRLR